MGYAPDWQRQNMKKTGASGPTTTEYRKDCGSLFHSSPAPQSKSATKPMRLADGDTEETYKARGLEASKDEQVGFFERLRMGNIDQPGSEAYNRFGAGRAALDAMDRDAEDIRSANRSPSPAASAPETKSSDDSGNGAFLGSYEDMAPAPSSAPAVSRPTARPAAPARRRATSSVSGSSTRASAPDESAAESRRLSSRSMSNDQSDAETARLARYAPRTTVRTAAPATSSRGQDRILRDTRPGEVDPKTLLPKR
jgi:hypothetical protein